MAVFMMRSRIPFAEILKGLSLQALQDINKSTILPPIEELADNCVRKTNDLKKALMNELNTADGKFSLSVESWSPKYIERYLVVTVYWIDSDWEFQNHLFNFKSISDEIREVDATAELCEILKGPTSSKNVCQLSIFFFFFLQNFNN